jgi:hypothetical protein
MFSHRFKVWCAKTIPVKFAWVPSDDLRCCPWIKAGNQDTIICFHKNNDVLKNIERVIQTVSLGGVISLFAFWQWQQFMDTSREVPPQVTNVIGKRP